MSILMTFRESVSTELLSCAFNAIVAILSTVYLELARDREARILRLYSLPVTGSFLSLLFKFCARVPCILNCYK